MEVKWCTPRKILSLRLCFFQAEAAFMVARGMVREAHISLEALQVRLKEVRDRLDRVSREDAHYLELATQEHKLLQVGWSNHICVKIGVWNGVCSKCRWFEVRRTKQHLFSRIVSRGSSSDTVLTHFGIAKRGSPHLSSNPKIQSLSLLLKAQFANVILHTKVVLRIFWWLSVIWVSWYRESHNILVNNHAVKSFISSHAYI